MGAEAGAELPGPDLEEPGAEAPAAALGRAKR
jgi:hypothetical protein